MQKTILITGATDGIGLETARMLAERGHQLLLHGRNPKKLEQVATTHTGGSVETYVADLSRLDDVAALAQEVSQQHRSLDVLINNAGVLKTRDPIAPGGLDVRFVVNTIAPYLLTQRLRPLLGTDSRVVNLSSAAQAPVSLNALSGRVRLTDMAAYSQSKLAILMWSRHLALANPNGPIFVALNPGSMLGSKMVKEAFGVAGGDLRTGADILVRAALSDEFANASGRYFDNDQRRFANPHPDALDDRKNAELVRAIETLLS
jgi:NAD(P)-dependent dehydrogenase (short-subunit alcohol dehydrogenase family)